MAGLAQGATCHHQQGVPTTLAGHPCKLDAAQVATRALTDEVTGTARDTTRMGIDDVKGSQEEPDEED